MSYRRHSAFFAIFGALFFCLSSAFLFYFLSFAHGQEVSEVDDPPMLFEAIAMLGRAKVVTPSDVGRVFGKEHQVDIWINDQPAPYSRATFERCRDENNNGRDWRFVYSTGSSVKELIALIEKQGRDHDNPPCFAIEKELNDWILRPEEDQWTSDRSSSGWKLLDMKPRFAGLSWQKQEDELAKLGDGYVRAHHALVSEALLDFFLLRNERLLSRGARDAHWSRAKTSSGAYVRIWFFMEKAVSFWPLDPQEETPEGPGVCVMIK